MTTKTLFLVLISLILLQSCKDNYDIQSNLEENFISVDSITYNNIYIANKKLCSASGLPFSCFKIEYPNFVEIKHPNNGSDHISIIYKQDGIVLEELNIGSSNLSLKRESMGLELISNLVLELEKSIESVKRKEILNGVFSNKQMSIFRGFIDCTEIDIPNYTGLYRIMMILPFPERNENINAPVVTFMAHESSKIRTFEDFENKGMIGNIWKTFKFLE